ncbi:RNA-binding S4 domain-containing protein [Clostridium bowmanii]|uniref:RNA-binding S4 domain-containing protein n=1 Tax=Clostridium bowmanii TaxID=132925 RepID=UPI001C0B3031|nr:RNA-binding S4 domain-containing protein [Clostridium bowmanii]MBU3190048.1 RNA-binding S4 domain-containing protein [Clostridium bowmanii]MCA1074643.1 RNA-binding S4 domain-containing protein [Clostridium bowmanii]
MNEIKIETDIIKLDSFLKWAGIACLGTEAKYYIKNEEIKLNGIIETQRGKKLTKGDIIEFNKESYKIV